MYQNEDPYTETYVRGIRLDWALAWRTLRNPRVKNRFFFRRVKYIGAEVVQGLKERNLDYLFGYEAFFADPEYPNRSGLGMTKRGAVRKLLQGKRRRKG